MHEFTPSIELKTRCWQTQKASTFCVLCRTFLEIAVRVSGLCALIYLSLITDRQRGSLAAFECPMVFVVAFVFVWPFVKTRILVQYITLFMWRSSRSSRREVGGYVFMVFLFVGAELLFVDLMCGCMNTKVHSFSYHRPLSQHCWTFQWTFCVNVFCFASRWYCECSR